MHASAPQRQRTPCDLFRWCARLAGAHCDVVNALCSRVHACRCASSENPWRARLAYQEDIHGETLVHIHLWAEESDSELSLWKLMIDLGDNDGGWKRKRMHCELHAHAFSGSRRTHARVCIPAQPAP
jgi:hypothetical protein